ncbi:hypothetical protein G6F23_015299 [Rhizopus arrhizus]|nr:hypothetical protein G6F23_015299 [Rhizopus arrhizus]
MVISFYIKASTLLTHIKEVGYTKYLCLTRLEEKGNAGEVVEVGPNVGDVKVGDRVFYMSGSAYAEYNKVPVGYIGKPSGFDRLDYDTRWLSSSAR